MKQKDIVTIIVTTFVSIIISIVAAKFLFATPKSREQQVEVVPPITSSFAVPSSQFFNSQSIDPTQLIQIGNSSNPNPFNSTTN